MMPVDVEKVCFDEWITKFIFRCLHSALTVDQMFRNVMETVGWDFPVSSFSIGWEWGRDCEQSGQSGPVIRTQINKAETDNIWKPVTSSDIQWHPVRSKPGFAQPWRGVWYSLSERSLVICRHILRTRRLSAWNDQVVSSVKTFVKNSQ